ncbi:MAG: AI-2E family transporter [Patescibacteria group bacterium]|jgi:predicted PurR-regulated permease PerM
MPKNLAKPFILILVVLVLIGCYLVFAPFLTEILMAAIMASIFYTPYEKFSKFLKGHNHLAAILMCLLLLVIIILPSVEFITYAGEKSVTAYNLTVDFFDNHTINDFFKNDFFSRGALHYLNLGNYNFNDGAFKETVLSLLKQSSNWLLSGATFVLKGTTDFMFSLVLIVLTMYFFFVDGKKMLERLMSLVPLPLEYNQELFRKFRAVSRTTFLATFVAAAAQGLVGAISFAVVGFPLFLALIIITFLSLLPLGSMVFYIPMGIYYLLVGDIWQGAFVILWGIFVVGTIDNVIRAYMIKDKAEINPIFVFFAVLGGIIIFGFWGVIIGPLLVALAVTVLHIYELEFCGSLENGPCEKIRKN